MHSHNTLMIWTTYIHLPYSMSPLFSRAYPLILMRPKQIMPRTCNSRYKENFASLHSSEANRKGHSAENLLETESLWERQPFPISNFSARSSKGSEQRDLSIPQSFPYLTVSATTTPQMRRRMPYQKRNITPSDGARARIASDIALLYPFTTCFLLP